MKTSYRFIQSTFICMAQIHYRSRLMTLSKVSRFKPNSSIHLSTETQTSPSWAAPGDSREKKTAFNRKKKLCPVQQHDLTSISLSESSCLCSFIYIYSNSLNMFSFREGIKVWSDMNWWWNKSRWQQRISGIRDLLSWRLSSICVWLVCFRLRFSRSFSLHFFC